MCKRISSETKDIVLSLISSHSASEISDITGVCKRSVFNIIRQNNVERSSEDKKNIRSRIRNKIIQDERRRVIFGREQKTQIKVVTNKKRHSLKYRLKRNGYVKGETVNTFYFNENTKRNSNYESIGKTMGLKILPE